MVRTLATYTRHRADRNHVILRCYLPAAAGQNLLMGAELTLAESQGGGKSAPSPTAETGSAKSVRERLQRHTSLRFTKDTWRRPSRCLADDVGVEIIIRGPDLQLDGITKNQSFGIDLADKPADEILIANLAAREPRQNRDRPELTPSKSWSTSCSQNRRGGPEVDIRHHPSRGQKAGRNTSGGFYGK